MEHRRQAVEQMNLKPKRSSVLDNRLTGSSLAEFMASSKRGDSRSPSSSSDDFCENDKYRVYGIRNAVQNNAPRAHEEKSKNNPNE